MSRITNRLGFTAVATVATVATVGLLWPVLVLSATATATADPAASPGVPCLASALGAPEQAAPLPPAPLTSLLEGLTAVAASNPAQVWPPSCHLFHP